MRRSERRKPVHIGLPWSLLFIPFMFIAAGLSIPYSLVACRVQRRNEEAFQVSMTSLGRVMRWSDFVRALDETRGTAILERYSFKGPVRWWWTSENIYDASPYPTVDWLTMFDESFLPFAEWCRERYTSPEQGQAFLVGRGPEEESRSLWTRLRSTETG
jgi:hypothetical protein